MDSVTDSTAPEELEPALALVRAMLMDGEGKGLRRQELIWAMLMEAVNGYAELHGHHLAAETFRRLSDVIAAEGRAGGRGRLQ